jgi:hypothetical protein
MVIGGVVPLPTTFNCRHYWFFCNAMHKSDVDLARMEWRNQCQRVRGGKKVWCTWPVCSNHLQMVLKFILFCLPFDLKENNRLIETNVSYTSYMGISAIRSWQKTLVFCPPMKK